MEENTLMPMPGLAILVLLDVYNLLDWFPVP